MAAAITADVVSKLFFGMGSTFAVAPVQLLPLSYYLLLIAFGAALGLFGAFITKTLLFSQRLYAKLSLSQPQKMMIPFAFAGLFGLFLPQVLGGGHGMIESLLHGQYALGLIVILLVGKFVFSMISYGSGAPGGIFFPLLVLGSLSGALFGQLAIHLGVVPGAYAVNFMLLGMAGMFTAIVRAPLTGIILIVEMSGSLTQLLSLSLVSICAYLVADLCRSKPVYESLLENLHPSQQSVAQPGERIFPGSACALRQLCQPKTHRPGTLAQGLPHHQCRARARNPDSPHGDLVLLPGDTLTFLCKAGTKRICESSLRQL